jgi:hypothetical protein
MMMPIIYLGHWKRDVISLPVYSGPENGLLFSEFQFFPVMNIWALKGQFFLQDSFTIPIGPDAVVSSPPPMHLTTLLSLCLSCDDLLLGPWKCLFLPCSNDLLK